MANSFSGKHVFTEKPIAISIDDCCKLEEAHEQAKHLKFATGFVLRHAPLYIEIQRLLLSGELGKVVSVEANEMLRPYHGGYIMRNWRSRKYTVCLRRVLSCSLEDLRRLVRPNVCHFLAMFEKIDEVNSQRYLAKRRV